MQRLKLSAFNAFVQERRMLSALKAFALKEQGEDVLGAQLKQHMSRSDKELQTTMGGAAEATMGNLTAMI
jgi:hypothetical protein